MAIKEAFERATVSPLTHGWTPWEAKEAVRAYGLAVRLALLDEILDGEYTLEQVADMRLNTVEGVVE